MLTSISPVGEAGRGQRWMLTVVAYIIGSAIGGAVTGAVVGSAGHLLLGWITQRAALAVVSLAAIAGLMVDARAHRTLPSWRRQVDERWLSMYRGWVYGFGFGVQLGAAFTTIVASSLVYVAFLAAMLTRSAVLGAVIGILFGVTRALPLVSMWPVRTTAALAARHRMVDRLRVPTVRATHLILAVTAVATAWGVVI